MFLVFTLILYCFAWEIEVTETRKIERFLDEKPGIKVAVTNDAIEYVAVQIIPFFKKLFEHMEFPEIHTKIGTPIGDINFDVTDFKLNSFDLSKPDLTIVEGNELQFTDDSVSGSASASWHYKQCSFPYVEDNGTFDLTLDISLTMKTGAKIDPSQKSKIKVQVNDLALDFNDFKLVMHGGASWLYNLLIGALKQPIEDAIKEEVKDQVPDAVTKEMQEALDKLDLDIEVFEGIFFNFQPDTILFSTDKKFLGIGISGDFYKDGVEPFPGSPVDIPDISSKTPLPMIMIFVSAYSCDTAGWVTDKAGILQYVLTNKVIPPEWPIKLNTSWFEILIPKLYEMFPNKEMQITFEADPTNTPEATFKNDGLQVNADADVIFQVVNNNNNEIVDAFTLDLALVANGTVSIGSKSSSPNKPNTQYIINGHVGYQSMKLTCKQSIVGDVNVKDIEETMRFLLDKVLIPIINQMLETGVPLPDIPYFTLEDPQIGYHGGYLEVRSDFTFVPPSEKEKGY